MSLTRLWDRAALASGTFIAFLLAGWLSGSIARQANGLEALWASNAVLLAILITRARSRGDIVAASGGGLAAGLTLHVMRSDPALVTFGLSIANVIECLVAFATLRRFGAEATRFERVGGVAVFIAACVGGAACSATIGASAIVLAGEARFGPVWLGWFVEASLSQLVLTPAIVLCGQLFGRAPPRGIAGRHPAEVAAILGLVAAVTISVFFLSAAPLMFLVTPTILIATLRLRAIGAVAAMTIVAIVGVVAGANGAGPIVHHVARPSDQILFLQLFLATIFLSALPVAAMIAERDARAEDARILADRLKTVVDNIGEVIFRTDNHGRWIYLNPAWETLSGYPVATSIGQSWLRLVHGADRIALIDEIQPMFAGKVPSVRRELRFHAASETRWVELLLQPLRDAAGQIVGATGTLRDIDDRKQLEAYFVDARRRAEERAREATLLASTDELTGLANRRAFLGRLDREIGHAADRDLPLAVAMFDVDHFKAVNDRYGHAAGDRVLCQIAARADAVVRHGDMVGRLGGEEFGIVMPGATAEDAALIAERLRQAMETPRAGDDPSLPAITVSVGLAVRGRHGDAGSLLAVADAALYAAKDDGRNRVRIAA